MISLYNAGVSLGSIKARRSRLVAQYRLDYELSRTREHCFCESTIGNILSHFPKFGGGLAVFFEQKHTD